MDRLICGDVGFGKTEVAMRAAFKAVMGGKQVAVLVPTTVLAQQHYNTFRERMADYPVRIEMLSRFRTAGAQQPRCASWPPPARRHRDRHPPPRPADVGSRTSAWWSSTRNSASASCTRSASSSLRSWSTCSP
jgi:hypothetical protein